MTKMTLRTHHKILLVSDETGGGAAVACRRLRDWLRRDGTYDCTWLAGAGASEQPDVVSDARPSVINMVIRRSADHVLRRMPGSARLRKRMRMWCNDRSLLRCVQREDASLVHLHNLHEYASRRFVGKLNVRMPIVWTLQDMWLLTGYCLHSFGCTKFTSGCRGHCPELGHWGMVSDSPATGWAKVERLVNQRQRSMRLVSPSRWLFDHARARFGDRLRIEHIPYGVDLNIFRPLDAQAARMALGLPRDRRIVLTGAVSLENKLKGFDYVVKVLAQLRGETERGRIAVVGFGDTPSGHLPTEWIASGRIQDERLLNMYFAAADVFLMPSLAENFSKALLESIAAGTPAVCFDVGGCHEIVRSDRTGYCVPSRDQAALTRAVDRVLAMDQERYGALRASCRRVAVAEYDAQRQVNDYLALYRELLNPAAG